MQWVAQLLIMRICIILQLPLHHTDLHRQQIRVPGSNITGMRPVSVDVEFYRLAINQHGGVAERHARLDDQVAR